MLAKVTFAVALASVTLMFCAFLAGVVDLLDTDPALMVLWQVVFVVACVVTLATLVVAVVNLVKRRDGVLSVATLMVPIIPTMLLGLTLVGAA